MAKMKKIEKEFCLTDSSVNVYGFRLMTSGYMLDEYKKNPIGYYMHDRNEGVVVRWDDLRVDGDKVYGKPVINLSNERGQQTADEVENGFLNGASVGHIVVVESSNDPSLMEPGQTGPTVTKWYNKECSLVDVPGNMSSLCLFDQDGNVINLADFNNQKLHMEKLFLSAAQMTALNLKADTPQAAVDQAISDLVAEAAKVPGLVNELSTANTAKKTAEDALVTLQAETTSKEVDALISTGVDGKKITAEVGTQLKAAYAGKPAELKALIDAMPAYQSVTGAIDKTTGSDEARALAAKTWSELDKEGKLEALKAADPETFKAKYKAEFNKDYVGKL